MTPYDPRQIWTAFWAEGTFTRTVQKRQPGRLYLEVTLRRREAWPECWTPEAIWAHPDLEAIWITFQVLEDGSLMSYHLVEMGSKALALDTSGHKVEPCRGSFVCCRKDAIENLGWGAQARRTTCSIADIAWVLHHWQPVSRREPTSARAWWETEGREWAFQAGLIPSEVRRVDVALDMADTIASPYRRQAE